MIYIYKADVWCDDCGRAICEQLKQAGKAPANPDNEWTYDSNDYPKGTDECESDTPEHCAAGKSCLNAITLPSGRKIGMLMGELTLAGIQYVKDAAQEHTEVTDLWLEHFRANGYDL